jgi:acyl-CoA synthetase (AMP-forming)/AMP-acid ligase II
MTGAVAQEKNLASAFFRQVRQNPHHPAIVAEDIRLDYERLWKISLVFADKMQAEGIGRRTLVFLLSRDAIASLAVMTATLLLGARFELFSDEGVQRSPEGVLLFSPDQRPPDRLPLALRSVQITPAWSPRFAEVPDPTSRAFSGYSSPDDPWWTLYTSGTTGRPKALLLSFRMAFDRSAAVAGDFRGAETRFSSLFPCTVRPFFVRAMAALMHGSTIVDSIDPAFLRDEGVSLVAGAPRHAITWAAAAAEGQRLPRLQVSGAPLSPEQIGKLLKYFEVVEDVYGSSETNKTYVTAYRQAPKGTIEEGVPQDSRVEIVDEAGLICPPGHTGRVRVRNGYSVDHYENAPEASARSFREGWFYPGDLAQWSESGALRIVGREDQLLNLGGDRIDPIALEAALMKVPEVRLAAVFPDPRPGASPRIAAAFEIEPGADQQLVLEAAIRACLKINGGRWTPQTGVVLESIPVTLDGTPRRQDCAKLALPLLLGALPEERQ